MVGYHIFTFTKLLGIVLIHRIVGRIMAVINISDPFRRQDSIDRTKVMVLISIAYPDDLYGKAGDVSGEGQHDIKELQTASRVTTTSCVLVIALSLGSPVLGGKPK